MGTMQICLFLLLGILIAKASARDKTFLTWNTQGAKWPFVVNFLGHYDVLAIQECGALYDPKGKNSFPYQLVPETTDTSLVGIDNNQITEFTTSADYVKSYKFTVNRESYYLYYYEARVDTNEKDNVNRAYSQYNMGIISNRRADRLYIITQDSNGDRLFIDRPILGIRVDNYMIFTTHTDPNRGTTAINDGISKVAQYMDAECYHTKWILMGDFNALPESVKVPADTPYCFYLKVVPDSSTRPKSGKIIDYAVYGGPINWKNSLGARTEAIVSVKNRLPSDHLPVAIEPINANNLG